MFPLALHAFGQALCTKMLESNHSWPGATHNNRNLVVYWKVLLASSPVEVAKGMGIIYPTKHIYKHKIPSIVRRT